MRCLILFVLAACELQPAPKVPPPAPAPTTAVPATPPGDAGVAVVADAAPAPSPPAAAEVSNPCLETGAHVAQVLVDSAKDPAVKAQYEQARDKIVRATAEACTKQAWSEDARRCFVSAKVENDLRACEKKFPPPGPPPPPPGHPKEG